MPSELTDWQVGIGQKHNDLKTSANGLAAQINIGEGNLDAAAERLKTQPDNNNFIRTVTANLLAAQSERALAGKNFDPARAKIAEAISLQPGNLNLALIPARIAALENDNQQALDTLDEVESTFGEQSAIVRARAQLLARDKRPEEAFATLETYYEKTGDLAVLPDLIGFTRITGSGKADEYTEEWVMKAPNNPPAHLMRADYLMQQGKEIEAVAHYESVLEQQPGNAAVMNNLAWTLRESDRNRALKLAEQAAKLAPENAPVLDTYGWILHLDGQHRAAAEQIEKALTLDPEQEESARHLEQVQQAL